MCGYYLTLSRSLLPSLRLLPFSNSHQLSEEIEDDLDLDPYADSRAQALLGHVLHATPTSASNSQQGGSGGRGSGGASGVGLQQQEESGSVGFALLVSVTRCVVSSRGVVR